MVVIRIDIEKSRVMLSPENSEEKAKLEALWKIMVDCVSYSRKLVPIGDYSPKKGDKTASFHIEGLKPQEQSFVEVKTEEAIDAYCKICNKVVVVKAGETIPICCGKMMEVID